MSNNLNNNLPENDSLTGLISNENFSHLNSELQNAIITSMNDNKRKEGGWLGRFLGIKPVNVAMHIGFLICAILMLVVIIDTIHAYIIGQSINIELLEIVFPIVTLSLGYIFGKGSNN